MTKQNGADAGTPDKEAPASLLGPDMSDPNSFFSDLAKKDKEGTDESGKGAAEEQEPKKTLEQLSDESKGEEDAGGKEEDGDKGKKPTPRWSTLEEAEQSQREADRKIAELTGKVDTFQRLIGDISDAERRVEAAKLIEARVKPYIGIDKAITSIDESIKNIVVPEEMMSGIDEETGKKVATEQDKMLAFLGDKKNLVSLITSLARANTESESKEREETIRRVDSVLFQLCKDNNEGKALNETELRDLAKVMGPDKVKRAYDPSTPEEYRFEILENALNKYLRLRAVSSNGKDGGEEEEDLEKKRRMASLLRSKAEPKHGAEKLSPESEKVVSMLTGLYEAAVQSRVELPFDKKSREGKNA